MYSVFYDRSISHVFFSWYVVFMFYFTKFATRNKTVKEKDRTTHTFAQIFYSFISVLHVDIFYIGSICLIKIYRNYPLNKIVIYTFVYNTILFVSCTLYIAIFSILGSADHILWSAGSGSVTAVQRFHSPWALQNCTIRTTPCESRTLLVSSISFCMSLRFTSRLFSNSVHTYVW